AGLPRLAAVKQSLALVPRSRGSRSVPRYFRMKSRKTLTLGVNRELSEYRAQGTTGFGCHAGKMGASRLAITGSRAIYSGKIAIPAPSSTSCRCTRGSSVTTRGARSGVTVFPPFESVHLPEPMQRCEVKLCGSGRLPGSSYVSTACEEATSNAGVGADAARRVIWRTNLEENVDIFLRFLVE